LPPHVVVNNITPRVSYSPTTGTSYTIPATWGFFASSDITVYSGTTALSYAASPTSSTQFATSGIAVDGGFQGGNIVLGAASTANTIHLILDVPVERATDFPYPAGSISIEDLNTDIDKAYVLMQQFKLKSTRALRQPDDDTQTIGALPNKAARASTFLGFDANGEPIAAAGTSANLGPVSAYINTLLDDADAQTARATLGLGTAATKNVDAAGGVPTLDASALLAFSTTPARVKNASRLALFNLAR